MPTTDYNAIVDLGVREPADEILDALADYHPALIGGRRGTIVAIITLPAENLRQATLTALAVTTAAIGREPFGVHVMTTADFDAYWAGDGEEISVQEAAQILGVTASAVRQRLSAGTLPGTRKGRDWRLPRQAIEQLEAGKFKPFTQADVEGMVTGKSARRKDARALPAG